MDKIYDVAIIGGGPGGYSAAMYCARAGFKTIILEKLSAGGQMATTAKVENYPGFDESIDGFELGEKMQKGAEKFGAETVFDEVTALDLQSLPKHISTSSSNVSAKAVILAMGASPKKMGIQGEDELVGNGVGYCATCDGMFYKNQTVVVAGGGNSAASDALTLSKICKKVYIVHRRDTLRAEKSYLDPIKTAGNIEFIWNTKIDKLIYDKKLTAVLLTDKTSGKSYELKCDGLFVAIGRSPDTDLVKDQINLDEQGYIIADETTKTSIPGVFAVGDIRTKPLRQIVTAASDGAVASKYVSEFIHTLK
ncbi:MAG: thioredoxin-disulfide reductase [Clostridia bacterium]|jgi:thioredoxin reductase (NADPH)|nr:thioredoxin-disulfide reductase [Clostridia bacterium]